jgi:DNA primase
MSGRPSKALYGHPRPLYVASAVLAEMESNTLLIAEGPMDALTACSNGYPAVAAPSASTWKRDAADWIADLGYEHHVVVGDCDDAGRRFADRAARDLAERGFQVRVLDLDPERDDGFDLGEFLLTGGRLP